VIEFGSDVEFAQNTNINVTVQPSGGDFTTINDALEYLTKTYLPSYKQNGITATITLDGFLGGGGTFINDQIAIVGIDLSWITITASTVQQVSKLSWSQTYGDLKPMFYAKNGSLPVIDVLFRVSNYNIPETDDNLRWFIALDNSRAEITTGSGVDNSPAGAHLINNSLLTAADAVITDYWFSGGINASNSTVLADRINLSNGLVLPISASDSRVIMNEADLTGLSTAVFDVQRTVLDLDDADIATTHTGISYSAAESSDLFMSRVNITSGGRMSIRYNCRITINNASIVGFAGAAQPLIGILYSSSLAMESTTIQNTYSGGTRFGIAFTGARGDVTGGNVIADTKLSINQGSIVSLDQLNSIAPSDTNIANFNQITAFGIIFK